MGIKNLLCLVLLCPLLLLSQDRFRIEGNISPENNGKQVLLISFDNNDLERVDVSIIKNGKFSFEGDAHKSELSIVALAPYISDESQRTQVYLEKGTINVNLGSVATISGTYHNSLLQDYHNLMKNNNQSGIVNFISQNTGNIIGREAFYDHVYNMKDDEIEAILSVAEQSFKQNEKVDIYLKGLKVIKSIGESEGTRKALVGTKFKDFEMETLAGHKVMLSDYVGKAKYTIIDFWASWCGPCIASMPRMKELYNEYNEKGVDMLSISIDNREARDAWVSAAERIDVSWMHLSNLEGTRSEMADSFAVPDIPYVVIVDNEGIVLKTIRLPDRFLKTALEELNFN